MLMFIYNASSYCELGFCGVGRVRCEAHLLQAPSSDVRVLDCRSHTWHNAPSMNVVRNYASASVYNGKIYAMGGVKDEESSYAEVFDTKTRTWECLPEPPSVIYNSRFIKISEVEGKIYVRNVKTDYAYDLIRGEWECCNGRVAMAMTSRLECVMENVSYSCAVNNGSRCCWYDIKNSRWEEVKGLDALNKYRRNVDSICSWLKLVSLSGKLLAIWDKCMMDPTRSDRTKIWCAEIVVEKRDGGEIWGKLKWVHVVHTAPFTCQLLHCLAITF